METLTMAKLSNMKPPVRLLLEGYPGSAKTGSLAALANAGWKLRVLDFDSNLDPLVQYTTPEGLDNIDVITCEDKLKQSGKFIGASGLPTAFETALKAMDNWKYKDEEGNEVDLGKSKDWGPDTIVVLDSLTSMGKAVMRRAMSVMNKTPLNTTQQLWGLAMADQEAFIEMLTSPMNRHHTIVLSHLKMVGPKDVAASDDELTKELKARVADVVPTRLYPSALGQQLPQTVASHFPAVVLAETQIKLNKPRRVLRFSSGNEIDLKLPTDKITGDLPVEDGLLTIFKALGHEPPKA
jgi:hypothetical protein